MAAAQVSDTAIVLSVVGPTTFYSYCEGRRAMNIVPRYSASTVVQSSYLISPTKIGRVVSEELIKSKCLPVLL